MVLDIRSIYEKEGEGGMAFGGGAMDNDLMKDLTCPICRDVFKTPKMLPCGHSLCQKPCLDRLLRLERSVVHCPECRTEIDVPYNFTDGFPTNFMVARLIDKYAATPPKPGPKLPEKVDCPNCKKPNYLIHCLHCNTSICEKCREIHTHRMKLDTTEKLSKLKRKTEDKMLMNAGQKASAEVDRRLGSIQRSIDIVANKAIEHIEQRRGKLKEEIQEFARKEQLAIVQRQTCFQESLEATKEFISDLEKKLHESSSSMNQTDMFKYQCDIGKWKTQNGALQGDAVLPTDVNFKFDQEALQATIASAGEVEVKERVEVTPMDTESEFIPTDIFPRPAARRAERTFRDEADILLHGKSRNKKKR